MKAHGKPMERLSLSYYLPRTPSYFTPTMTSCSEKEARFSLSVVSHERLFWHLYKERRAATPKNEVHQWEHTPFLTRASALRGWLNTQANSAVMSSIALIA